VAVPVEMGVEPGAAVVAVPVEMGVGRPASGAIGGSTGEVVVAVPVVVVVPGVMVPVVPGAVVVAVPVEMGVEPGAAVVAVPVEIGVEPGAAVVAVPVVPVVVAVPLVPIVAPVPLVPLIVDVPVAPLPLVPVWADRAPAAVRARAIRIANSLLVMTLLLSGETPVAFLEEPLWGGLPLGPCNHEEILQWRCHRRDPGLEAGVSREGGCRPIRPP